MPKSSSESAHRINLLWLSKLRWTMIIGQIFLLSMVKWWLKMHIPLAFVSTLIVFAILSNITIVVWLHQDRPAKEWMLTVIMIIDVLLLTGLLNATGGPANPFSFLYLIYIALGIVILSAETIWFLGLLTLLSYGSLFLLKGKHTHNTLHSPAHMKMHLEGMWVAYAITTVFIAYFVTRMKYALMRREAEVQALHDLQIRSEKLAALAALAGGAVHEFSTPLSTIAVIAKEMERSLSEQPTLQEDAQLIRTEVERCKRISQELMSQAGEALGEESLSIPIQEVFETALLQYQQSERVHIDISQEASKQSIPLPPQAFQQVLRGLLNNAEEASSKESPIHLLASMDTEHFVITVKDRGTGIPEEIIHRLGEPFFTTKAASEGHGLSLFLAKTLMERLGGQLQIHSVVDEGTEIRLCFPKAVTNTAH